MESWRILFLLLCPVIFGARKTPFKVLMDDFAIDYLNTKLAACQANVFMVDDVKRLNATMWSKLDVPQLRFQGAAYGWINGDYKAQLAKIDKSVKSVTKMELFGINELMTKYLQPQLSWPIRKDMKYRIISWAPNAAKFPPSPPEGKYKINVNFSLMDGPQLSSVSVYASITYK